MGDPGSGSSAADSYIGSLISLTSKSEIRYEGVLFTVDTENSNIALQNVRSYGTEGRKKQGPQIPASDKVYDYIVFRGKDIKDLQVKSGPPAPAPPVDPAIVSMPSGYSQVAPMPPAFSGVPRQPPLAADAAASAPTAYPTIPPSAFQSGAALQPYNAGPGPGTLMPRAGAPAPASGGPAPSSYWDGYYHGPSGVDPQATAQLPQSQTLLTPPSQINSGAGAQAPRPVAVPEGNSGFNSSAPPAFGYPGPRGLDTPAMVTPAKGARRPIAPTTASGPAHTVQGRAQAPGSGALEQPPRNSLASSLHVRPEVKAEMEGQPPVANAALAAAANLHLSSSPQGQGQPLLPLPSGMNQKQHHHHQQGPQGSILQPMNNRRGGYGGHRGPRGGGGRGSGIQSGTAVPATTQFTEDFDFTAMNEKFKKEEVWGALGGGGGAGGPAAAAAVAAAKEEKEEAEKKSSGKEEGEEPEEEEERQTDGTANGSDGAGKESAEAATAAKKATTPVYDKDDFFDKISCDALDREHGAQRSRFSEMRKVDIETFGQAQMRSMRGGRGGRGRRGGHDYRGGGYGYGGYGGYNRHGGQGGYGGGQGGYGGNRNDGGRGRGGGM